MLTKEEKEIEKSYFEGKRDERRRIIKKLQGLIKELKKEKDRSVMICVE